MEQKQYVSALQMYKNCMNKFNRQMDVQLLIYIARAYWKAQKYSECRDYVEKVYCLLFFCNNFLFCLFLDFN